MARCPHHHLLGNAHADLRDSGCFTAYLDIVAQVVSQVEKPLPTPHGEVFEMRLPDGKLRAMRIRGCSLA